MKDFFNSFKIFSNEEIDQLLLVGVGKSLKKGDYFIKEGKICKDVAFIKSGLFRSYYTSSTGEEITYCINFPDSLMTAYSSFITNEPTPETIQAIADAELFVFPKREIEKLAEGSYNWLVFFRMVAEQQYMALEKRIFLLQKEKARQRYLDMLKNQPKYVQQIPLQYLASFLGITQRHLSRLRKEITF